MSESVKEVQEHKTPSVSTGPELAAGSNSESGTTLLVADEGTWQHIPTPGVLPERVVAALRPIAPTRKAPADNTSLSKAEQAAVLRPTPENFLDLSLAYYKAGRFNDCIGAARQALKLKPSYAEAYNNIAAAYQSMADWDSAIDALRQALRLKPNYQLAKNNLALSQAQKRKLKTP